MKQYCRYCSNMCCGDANWCDVKEETYSDSYIKHTNNCKHFVFNPIDALQENLKGYHPRKNNKIDEHQTKLFDDRPLIHKIWRKSVMEQMEKEKQNGLHK